MGPNGEIILPQVWETVVEPDWSITMHMWPMEEPEKPKPPEPPMMPPLEQIIDVGPPPAAGKRPGRNKNKNRANVPPAPPPIPMHPHGPAGAGFEALLNAPGPPGHAVGPGGPLPAMPGGGGPKKKNVSPLTSWMLGGSRKPGSGKGAKEIEVLIPTPGGVLRGTGVQRTREPGKKVAAVTSDSTSCAVM